MIPGKRFEIDLADDGIHIGDQVERPPTVQGAFVGDVLERRSTAAAPAPPSLKSKAGFPEHRRRNVESKFKKQHKSALTIKSDDSALQLNTKIHAAGDGSDAKSWEEEEKQRIDHENRQKLAELTTEEIEEEQRQLMSQLGPDLIQRLLNRSNIDSGSAEQDLAASSRLEPQDDGKAQKQDKKVSFAAEPTVTEYTTANAASSNPSARQETDAPLDEALVHDSVHFPRPQQPPDLDPSSETFLQDLHTKYFPSLPSDPNKLEWMQPTSQSGNTYDPSSSALSAKDLRFSFKGELIPPRIAAEIPVTAGLHHHGDAPDSAGYTISELALLAQSSYPAQRCIAFQTLGRILYRLGLGEFGDSGEPGEGVVGGEETFGELARGLWREVDRNRVIEILVQESEGKGVDRGRHVSAKAYATEAVWLWRKGGGRRWKAE